jgi:hypothetical protein
MKKILLFAAACLFTITIYAQTGQEIKASELPKTTTDYVAKNFPGCQIGRAGKVDDPNKQITYIVMMTDGSHKYVVCFDAKGNFLKKGDKSMLEQFKLTPAGSKPQGKAQTGTGAQPQSAPKK